MSKENKTWLAFQIGGFVLFVAIILAWCWAVSSTLRLWGLI